MTPLTRFAPVPRPVCVLVLAGVLAGALSGCAVTAGWRADTAASASNADPDPAAGLDLPRAGVRDRRALFGELMQQALATTPRTDTEGGADRSAAGYLRLPDGPSRQADAAAALRRRASARMAHTVVLVVPGLFSDCVASQSLPFGDGKARDSAQASYTQAYADYARVLPGVEVKALPVHGRASSTLNGGTVAAALVAEAARADVRRIVVVAYSKGMTDTLHALDDLSRAGTLPDKLEAVVSVAGVVRGTHLADEFGRLYDLAPAGLAPLDCPPSMGGEVDSLTHEQRLAWLQHHPLPGSLRYYSVVAHADPATVSPGLRAFHQALGRIDPLNDGQMIGADALLPGSDLLGIVRSDHWTFVLPLEGHPSPWVRALSSSRPWPRAALLQATIWYVLGTSGDAAAPLGVPSPGDRPGLPRVAHR